MYYLCKYWGLDDLLYVIGDEDVLDDSRFEDIDENPHNIYFLVELRPV